MNINFSKGNIEITQAMQNHAESKLGRLERHLKSISHIDITIKKQGDGFSAEALVHNERARFPQVHARAKSEDYHSTIDQLEAKLIRQIDTLRNKRQESHRHNQGNRLSESDLPGDAIPATDEA